MRPALSVVIPSFARADLLSLCLGTVTRFAPPGTQILVVDDASHGGLISRIASAYPSVEILRLPKRSGFCVAANAGVRAASGEIVELLNDDTEVAANWADAAMRWFADPRIAAVSPLVLQNDLERRKLGLPPLIDTAGDEYDPGGFARKRGHGRVCTPELTTPGPVWGVSGAAGFFRRRAFLDVGGFPEDFGAYFEDVDLSFRLRKAGLEAWYEPGSVVWHRVSASYGKRPNRKTLAQQSCNEERVYWRNIEGRYRSLPRHGAVLVGKAARRLREGSFIPWACGRLKAWCSAVDCRRIGRSAA